MLGRRVEERPGLPQALPSGRVAGNPDLVSMFSAQAIYEAEFLKYRYYIRKGSSFVQHSHSIAVRAHAYMLHTCGCCTRACQPLAPGLSSQRASRYQQRIPEKQADALSFRLPHTLNEGLRNLNQSFSAGEPEVPAAMPGADMGR